MQPEIVICDEPTSRSTFGAGADPEPADDLRRDFNLTYVFISHNLRWSSTSPRRFA